MIHKMFLYFYNILQFHLDSLMELIVYISNQSLYFIQIINFIFTHFKFKCFANNSNFSEFVSGNNSIDSLEFIFIFFITIYKKLVVAHKLQLH